jgi:hypothetical protein
MALAIVGVACSGPLDEDAAIAAAVEASGFREPISVVVVEAGEAGKLNHGVPGSVTSQQEIDAARERASRPAWRVVLTGVAAARTKSGEFIIDRDTGAVLYSSVPAPP